MAEQSVADMNEKLARLLVERLSLPAVSLTDQLAQAERQLPRRLRAPLTRMVEAELRSSHPKLRRQLDERQIRKDYSYLTRQLKALNRGARAWAVLEAMTSSVLGIVVSVGIVVLLLLWGGGFL